MVELIPVEDEAGQAGILGGIMPGGKTRLSPRINTNMRLYVWIRQGMEGPSAVSLMCHSVTMWGQQSSLHW